MLEKNHIKLLGYLAAEPIIEEKKLASLEVLLMIIDYLIKSNESCDIVDVQRVRLGYFASQLL